jgi:hypothetical protein
MCKLGKDFVIDAAFTEHASRFFFTTVVNLSAGEMVRMYFSIFSMLWLLCVIVI